MLFTNTGGFQNRPRLRKSTQYVIEIDRKIGRVCVQLHIKKKHRCYTERIVCLKQAVEGGNYKMEV